MQVSESIIQDMVRIIIDEASPEQVILFGSYASGDVHDDSDVDLLVIESGKFDKKRSRRQETGRIRKALSGFNVAVDILLYSTEEVTRWRSSLNHVIARALREGKVVYERH